MSFNEGGTDFISILFFVYYIQKDTEIFVLCYIFTNKTQIAIMKTTYENDSIYKNADNNHKTNKKMMIT